ncbi:bidirectional sugar transporter SWEET16-like [Punica granatum]|uniref:Bidirectional sugar transporter SWEET n=2 Tax=Punica granatum TaxID=22663 RepID=A0A6P8DZ85_PUNGR|nr:bidirectional sugar transporter SWEET16-like [Punica granatum]
MRSLSFVVGVIGNIISVLMFLSPVPTFWRIVKQRSTEDFSSIPYVCTLLNSSLWTYYGIIKPGSYLVSTVNGFGIIAEIIYIAIFLIFAPLKIKLKTAALVGTLDVGFLGVAMAVTFWIMHGDARIDVVGFLASGLNIIMYGSPLSAMKTVVTTKSVEYMPFFLSFFFFLNGGVWTLYATLVRDLFLGVPNGIGFLLGVAQLVLYAIYRKTDQQNKNDPTTLLEDGWENQRLIDSPSNNIDSHRREQNDN